MKTLRDSPKCYGVKFTELFSFIRNACGSIFISTNDAINASTLKHPSVVLSGATIEGKLIGIHVARFWWRDIQLILVYFRNPTKVNQNAG